jgi:Ca2+-binding EF-hand superfamily protein
MRRLLVALTAGALCGLTASARAADWDDERAARAYVKLDTNNNGAISLDEFLAGSGNDATGNTIFNRLDTDDSDSVSHRELRSQWDVANNVLRKDVYEVDPVTQGRAMEMVFNGLDTDGDELLSLPEFEAGVRRNGPGEFNRIDDNRDGKLSHAEFVEDWNRFRKIVRSEAFYNHPAAVELVRADRHVLIYTVIDSDRDGRVDLAEYRAALKAAARAEAGTSFRVMDLNHDGSISRNEFEAGWEPIATLIEVEVPAETSPAVGVERRQVIERREVIVEERREVTPSTAAIFDKIDANDDGRLTVHELQAGVTDARAQATRGFNKLDRDEDGYVDRAEFDGGWAALQLKAR